MKSEYKIFYSWQDDTERGINRYFILGAIKRALKNINKRPQIDESPRQTLRLDHDTKNVPGMPDIVNTILQKIDECDLFIADLTFISKTISDEPQNFFPNPNVIFELGYALKAIGSSRIICIMNTSFGNPDKLFFDLLHRRWPITYSLTTKKLPNKKDTLRVLSFNLESAILQILKNEPKGKQIKNRKTTIFTKTKEEEFKYIYDKLDRKIHVNIQVGDLMSFSSSNIPKYSCSISLVEVLMLYLYKGNIALESYKIEGFLSEHLRKETYFEKYGNIKLYTYIKKEEFITQLKTLGLTKPNSYYGAEFSNKAYNFYHWLDYNNLNTGKITLTMFKKIK